MSLCQASRSLLGATCAATVVKAPAFCDEAQPGGQFTYRSNLRYSSSPFKT